MSQIIELPLPEPTIASVATQAARQQQGMLRVLSSLLQWILYHLHPEAGKLQQILKQMYATLHSCAAKDDLVAECNMPANLPRKREKSPAYGPLPKFPGVTPISLDEGRRREPMISLAVPAAATELQHGRDALLTCWQTRGKVKQPLFAL